MLLKILVYLRLFNTGESKKWWWSHSKLYNTTIRWNSQEIFNLEK